MAARARWLSRRRGVHAAARVALRCAMLVLLPMPVPASAETRVEVRITGDAAGPGCDVLAVGVVRTTLRYPLLGGLGWGPGVPTTKRNVAELHVLRRADGVLRRQASIDAPRRWTDARRYALAPRGLPDGHIVFALRGCPREEPNCRETRYFRLGADGRHEPIAAWPEVTARESANLRHCTSYLSYEGSTVLVNVGPTGGPWLPVLRFDGNRLRVVAP